MEEADHSGDHHSVRHQLRLLQPASSWLLPRVCLLQVRILDTCHVYHGHVCYRFQQGGNAVEMCIRKAASTRVACYGLTLQFECDTCHV